MESKYFIKSKQPKYGYGKKRESVTVSNKKGKVFSRNQEVGVKEKKPLLKNSKIKARRLTPDKKELIKQYPGIPFSLIEKIKREKGKGKEVDLNKKDVRLLLQKGVVGFVSAGKNPNDPNEKDWTEEDVMDRDEQLRNDLVKMGFKFSRVRGKYGEEEDSFMVMLPYATRNEMKGLGKKYNQDSIIYSQFGKNEMIFTMGENAGKKFRGNGFEVLKNSASDFYSEIETPEGKMKFSLDFDFDNMVKKSFLYIHFNNDIEKAFEKNKGDGDNKEKEKQKKTVEKKKLQSQKYAREDFEQDEIDQKLKHLSYIRKKYSHIVDPEKFNDELTKLRKIKRTTEDMIDEFENKKFYIKE